MKTQNEIGDTTSIEIEGLEFLAASLRLQAKTIPHFPSKCCIYKTAHPLRELNEAAYSPKVVSIGPIHHGKENLRYMEENKWRYLQNVLEKKKTFDLENCMKKLKELEERCRQCYSETIHMNSNEFVRMMLLDSIFISEFFFQWSKDKIRCESGPLNNLCFWEIHIRPDILLLENQLPFFIVKYIFNLILDLDQEDKAFECLALRYFNSRPEISGITFLDLIENELALNEDEPAVIENELALNEDEPIQNEDEPALIEDESDVIAALNEEEPALIEDEPDLIVDEPDHLLDLFRSFLISSSQRAYPQQGEKSEIPECATNLHEAGVKFKVNKDKTLLDITFGNGVLEMPFLCVTETIESIFRNLIALEQCHAQSRYVSDFAFLMDSLINTHADVALLCHEGIIENWLGNNEEVALLFNKLCQNITINPGCHCYQDVFQGLVAHSKKSWNKQMANLKHNYFSTPWKTISLVAAFILVVLTIIQTVTSILSLKG